MKENDDEDDGGFQCKLLTYLVMSQVLMNVFLEVACLLHLAWAECTCGS